MMTEVYLDVKDSDNKMEYHECQTKEGKHTKTDNFVKAKKQDFKDILMKCNM